MSALAGRRIVVTRPVAQAGDLSKLIRDECGEPVLFPAIEIRDVEDARPLNALLQRLDQFDLAIFVSPNAVNKVLGLIHAPENLRRGWPAGLRAATIGPGSEKALRRHGVAEVIAPAGRFAGKTATNGREIDFCPHFTFR